MAGNTGCALEHLRRPGNLLGTLTSVATHLLPWPSRRRLRRNWSAGRPVSNAHIDWIVSDWFCLGLDCIEGSRGRILHSARLAPPMKPIRMRDDGSRRTHFRLLRPILSSYRISSGARRCQSRSNEPLCERRDPFIGHHRPKKSCLSKGELPAIISARFLLCTKSAAASVLLQPANNGHHYSPNWRSGERPLETGDCSPSGFGGRTLFGAPAALRASASPDEDNFKSRLRGFLGRK